MIVPDDFYYHVDSIDDTTTVMVADASQFDAGRYTDGNGHDDLVELLENYGFTPHPDEEMVFISNEDQEAANKILSELGFENEPEIAEIFEVTA